MRSIAPTLLLALALAGGGPAQSASADPACAQEAELRSLTGDTATEITFVNDSPRPARTYWLNYQGQRVFYNELAPGKWYTQKTYVTHPWIITNNQAGECAAIYQPTPSPRTVTIR
jgi:von Hippel-Lindau disease tumor supressor